MVGMRCQPEVLMKSTSPLYPRKHRAPNSKNGLDHTSTREHAGVPCPPYLCHADTRAYSLCSGPPGRAIRNGFMW